MIRKYKLNWQPDLKDERDFVYLAPSKKLKALPESFDLRDKCPKVYDQGSLGSCVANAIAGQMQILAAQSEYDDYMPSRLFIYYFARALSGDQRHDSGTTIRNGIKVVASRGSADELVWPYKIKKFKEQPPSSVQKAAKKNVVDVYQRVNVAQNDIKTALVNGHSIAVGFPVHESFGDVGKNGMVPIPGKDERVEGGHAICIVGYNPTHAIVRNSWSASWGDKGYCYFKWEHVLKYFRDAWIIKKL